MVPSSDLLLPSTKKSKKGGDIESDALSHLSTESLEGIGMGCTGSFSNR